MRVLVLAVAIGAVLSACAHRPPAPIESRTVQQADQAAQRRAGDQPPAPAPGAKPAPPEKEAPVPPGMHRVKRGETLIGIALENGVDWRELAAWNQIANPNRIEVGQLLTVKPPAPPKAPALAASPAPSPAPSASISAPGGIEVKPLAPATPGSGSGPAAPVAPGAVPGPPTAVPAPPPAVPAPPAASGPAEAADALNWAWPANGGVITQFSEGGSKGIAIAGAAGEAVFASERGRVVYSGNGLRGYGNLVIVKHSNDFITAYAHNRAVLVKEGQTVRRGQKIAELGMSDADRPMLHFELRKGGKPVDPLGFLPSR
ncbi:MAG: hypothetical protein RLY30_991 [Pseudomonadota bacterium]